MVDTATTVETVIEGEDKVSEATTTGIEQKPFIVGEHSVYNTVEDLYQGAVQKEQYIKQLSKENAELKAQLKQNTNTTNILQELKGIRKETLMTDNVNNVENTTTLTDDTIKEIALKAMQEEQVKLTEQKNLADCKSMLGSSEDDIALALQNKASELGVTVEDLTGMAATKPQLFKRLFDIKEAPKTSYIPSSVRQINNTPTTSAYEEFIKNASDAKYIAALTEKALKDPSIVADWEWK